MVADIVDTHLGRQDAVLFYTFITVEHNLELAEWVEKSEKNLIAIDATRGHGDHFFGVSTIRQRFPKARFVAPQDVINVMHPSLLRILRNGQDEGENRHRYRQRRR